MWTSYRQCQLHLDDLVFRFHNALFESTKEFNSRRNVASLRGDIERHIDDTFASLPYVLAGDDINYCKPEEASWQLPKPPLLLGGLSMQWVRFTIATLENASAAHKQQARDMLSWFGDALGIGQATVLANVLVALTLCRITKLTCSDG